MSCCQDEGNKCPLKCKAVYAGVAALAVALIIVALL